MALRSSLRVLLFTVMMIFASALSAQAWDIPASPTTPVPSPAGCLSATPCTCAPAGGSSSPLCRVCSVTDQSVPAYTYNMMVCSSLPVPQVDALACTRAKNVCNKGPAFASGNPTGGNGGKACSDLQNENAGAVVNGTSARLAEQCRAVVNPTVTKK